MWFLSLSLDPDQGNGDKTVLNGGLEPLPKEGLVSPIRGLGILNRTKTAELESRKVSTWNKMC